MVKEPDSKGKDVWMEYSMKPEGLEINIFSKLVEGLLLMSNKLSK